MTSPLRVLPDVEALVVAFSRADADVSSLLGVRIYGDSVPHKKTYPLARVHRFGGVPVMQVPLEIDTATLQLDVWDNTKRGASNVMRTWRSVLAARLPGVHDFGGGVAGVITAVDIGVLSYDPDAVFDPPKPRYITDVSVSYRPL